MTGQISMRGPMRLGCLALALLIFGFGFWSVTARLSGAIVVPGRIATDQSPVALQHPDGGVVAAVHVVEGQQVAAGQVLLSLDGSALRSDLALVEDRIGAISARAARLLAERDGMTGMDITPELAALAAMSPDITAQIDGQADLLRARQATLAEVQDQLNARVDQVKAQAHGLVAQKLALEEELDIVQGDLSDQQRLLDNGLAVRARVLALERERAQLTGQIAAMDAAVASARSQAIEIGIQIDSLALRRREEAEAELREIEPQLQELQERRRALRERIARLDLRAPIAGTVLGLRVSGSQMVLRAADPALTLVPSDTSMIATARVAPKEGDRVWKGQLVELRLDPFKGDGKDRLTGRVTQVSADTVTDPVTGSDHYLVRVEILSAEPDHADLSLLGPGMPVQLMLQTGERTPFTYLWEPFGSYFARAMRES